MLEGTMNVLPQMQNTKSVKFQSAKSIESQKLIVVKYLWDCQCPYIPEGLAVGRCWQVLQRVPLAGCCVLVCAATVRSAPESIRAQEKGAEIAYRCDVIMPTLPRLHLPRDPRSTVRSDD